MKKVALLILLFIINSILFGQSYRVGKTKTEVKNEYDRLISLNIYKRYQSLIDDSLNILGYIYINDGSAHFFYFDNNNICGYEILICHKDKAKEINRCCMNSDMTLHKDIWISNTDKNICAKWRGNIVGDMELVTFRKELMNQLRF